MRIRRRVGSAVSRGRRSDPRGGGVERQQPVTIVVDWRHNSDGSLSALVAFRLRPAAVTAADATAGGTASTVTLYWRSSTCNVRPQFRYCDLPNSDNSRTYYAYNSQACRYIVRTIYTGWPKKVSRYQDSSLNRIKNCQCGYISHQS